MLGDGDPWIEHIAQGPYFMATYQLDWRHLMVKIQQTFSDQPKLIAISGRYRTIKIRLLILSV